MMMRRREHMMEAIMLQAIVSCMIAVVDDRQTGCNLFFVTDSTTLLSSADCHYIILECKLQLFLPPFSPSEWSRPSTAINWSSIIIGKISSSIGFLGCLFGAHRPPFTSSSVPQDSKPYHATQAQENRPHGLQISRYVLLSCRHGFRG